MPRYLIAVLSISLVGFDLHAQNPAHGRPPTLTAGWKTGTPDSAGLDPAGLARLIASVRTGLDSGVHAVLIESVPW